MFEGRYQSSDLTETNYANVAEALGCQGLRIEDPADLAPALATGMANRHRPTLLDVVVTRDPAKMLPGVDSRTLEVKPGDRPV
jgi:acetolactate synthase-1/2/3 large subunit